MVLQDIEIKQSCRYAIHTADYLKNHESSYLFVCFYVLCKADDN